MLLKFILQEDVDEATPHRRTLKNPEFIMNLRNSSIKKTVDATVMSTNQSTLSRGVVLSKLPNSMPMIGREKVAKCTNKKSKKPEARIA